MWPPSNIWPAISTGLPGPGPWCFWDIVIAGPFTEHELSVRQGLLHLLVDNHFDSPSHSHTDLSVRGPLHCQSESSQESQLLCCCKKEFHCCVSSGSLTIKHSGFDSWCKCTEADSKCLFMLIDPHWNRDVAIREAIQCPSPGLTRRLKTCSC